MVENEKRRWDVKGEKAARAASRWEGGEVEGQGKEDAHHCCSHTQSHGQDESSRPEEDGRWKRGEGWVVVMEGEGRRGRKRASSVETTRGKRPCKPTSSPLISSQSILPCTALQPSLHQRPPHPFHPLPSSRLPQTRLVEALHSSVARVWRIHANALGCKKPP